MTIRPKRCSKGSIPIVKQFLAENFVRSKMIPKMVLFRGNGGLDVRLYVRDLEKAHPLSQMGGSNLPRPHLVIFYFFPSA